MNFIMFALVRLIDLYIIVIIIRAIMSWFTANPHNEIYQLLIRITEPVLAPFRRLFPTMTIDFSPLIVIILLQLLKNMIIGAL